ncbi:HSP20 family protein [Gammaproteobacteria bacterium]
MNQLRQGLGRALENLTEGWHQVVERAGDALTRFNPVRQAVESPGALVERYAPRWGIVAAELREDGDALVIKLELPGMEPEQFDVDVVDDFLVIRGEKRVEREEARGRYHLMECAYGSFERAIRLPMPVDPTRTKARYRHGVLTITLPKLASHHTRRIKVNSESTTPP